MAEKVAGWTVGEVDGWTVGRFWREEVGVKFTWMPDNSGEIDGRISVRNLCIPFAAGGVPQIFSLKNKKTNTAPKPGSP
ncbi:MAG: hypothetical protein JNJ90_04025 [Saprospiraceae bacterium]|nr:hypothetical protein [Saprospiraceae bacterium]